MKRVKNLLKIALSFILFLITGMMATAQTPTVYTVKYDNAGSFTFPKLQSVSPRQLATTAPNIYVLAGGGSGYNGEVGMNLGAGGGGGGASARLTGYEILNYAIPFVVGAAGQNSTFGNGEVTVNKGGNATGFYGASGGSASTTGAVSSAYGSSVKIANSYGGGSGCHGENCKILLDFTDWGGSGGGGAGKSAAGNNAAKINNGITNCKGSDEYSATQPGAASSDGFGGSGGSHGSSASAAGFGGGGHGAGDEASTFPASSGGKGRVWVEVNYTYTGVAPVTPALNLTDQCYEKAVLDETLSVTNPESDVQYTWYRSRSASITSNDVLLKQGIGIEYQSYSVTTPGYYYVIARRFDTGLSLSNFSGATALSPMPFGSDKIASAVVKFGRLPKIDNLSTTFDCSVGPITHASFTGIIPSGTIYLWGAPTNPDNVQRATGVQSVLTNSFTSGNLLNMNENEAVVTYTITPRDTLNGVVCIGNPFTVTITVPSSGLKLEV